MAEKEPTLSFNRETGYYEGMLLVQVDAEIFRRTLFRYLEENNIDMLDMQQYQAAIQAITRVGRWVDHPHTLINLLRETKPKQEVPQVVEETKLLEPMAHTKKPLHSKYLVPEDEVILRELALRLPVDEWESLLTPLPANLPIGQSKEKEMIYQRRYAERQALNKLKQELEPARNDMLHAIAESVNGARIH